MELVKQAADLQVPKGDGKNNSFEQIANAFMQVYGDPVKFAIEFVATSRASKPGTKLKAMTSLIGMFKDNQDRMNDPTKDIGQIEDADLQQRIRKILQEIESEGAIDVDFDKVIKQQVDQMVDESDDDDDV